MGYWLSGIFCSMPEEVVSQLGNEKVAIKAQVLIGGRGKAGGAKLAGNAEEALQYAERILGITIKDVPLLGLLSTKR